MISPFYRLEPEVAGGWGDDTVADTTVHPPVVTALHYVFDGWLGDSIVESFPCYLVTAPLGDALVASGLSGFELRSVRINKSEQFAELYPDRKLPEFRWLHVTGAACVDDFGLSGDHLLVASTPSRSSGSMAVATVTSTRSRSSEVVQHLYVVISQVARRFVVERSCSFLLRVGFINVATATTVFCVAPDCRRVVESDS